MQPMGATEHGLSQRAGTVPCTETRTSSEKGRNQKFFEYQTLLNPAGCVAIPPVYLHVKPSRGSPSCKRRAWCSFCLGSCYPVFRKTTATAAFFLISFPYLAVVYVVMLQGIVSMDQALSLWYLQANTLPGCLDHKAEKGPRVM